LFSHNKELESEFRNEVLLNEQYKQMLSVLKSSMEAKIEELGLDSILDYSLSKPTKPSFIKNKVDIFTEMVKIRTEIKNWNSSKKLQDSMVSSLEESNITFKERVKILQTK